MHNEIHPGLTVLVLYIWFVCLLLLGEIPSFLINPKENRIKPSIDSYEEKKSNY